MLSKILQHICDHIPDPLATTYTGWLKYNLNICTLNCYQETLDQLNITIYLDWRMITSLTEPPFFSPVSTYAYCVQYIRVLRLELLEISSAHVHCDFSQDFGKLSQAIILLPCKHTVTRKWVIFSLFLQGFC